MAGHTPSNLGYELVILKGIEVIHAVSDTAKTESRLIIVPGIVSIPLLEKYSKPNACLK
jgi:hypothetical protein